MPIQIDKIRIYNFRSIKKTTLELSTTTLLIGANNSGKTSLLKALNIALGIGTKKISPDDFNIGASEENQQDKSIIIDVHIIPIDDSNNKSDSFDDLWREKQFGELINIDLDDTEYFSFRTTVFYDILKGDYSIKKYKIKEWKDQDDWETINYSEELRQYFDNFPLFFIDAQRDIIADLNNRTSYFGRMINKIKIDDDLIKELEDRIKTINEDIVSNSQELLFIKEELQKIKSTISTGSTIEINPVNKKIRDINRGVNINLQDIDSESFPLDYHGMGTRSWASLLTFSAFISWQYKNSIENNEPFHTILALEEPEAHLHPSSQRTLYKQLSELKGQKIISTHSPFIASQAKLEELRHFKKKNGISDINRIDLSNLLPEDIRKLHREVMHTRGELLFSDLVVLFEGETEEQALPIFAEKYFNQHPYELGIYFIGVGGDSGYTPFLRLLLSFKINWLIFSDGEEISINKVKDALTQLQIDADNNPNLVLIPNNMNIEEYLISEGYQNEIKTSIINFEKDNNKFQNEQHQSAREVAIQEKSDDDIYKYMKAWKTKLSPYYAKTITDRSDVKSIPSLIRTLFEKIGR